MMRPQGVAAESAAQRLVRKLEDVTELTVEDRRAILEAVSGTRLYPAHEILSRGAASPTSLNFVLSGFTCCYKTLPDGRRQIVAYYLPGDLCDIRLFMMNTTDH